jgi:hypothetical protein
MRVNVHRLIERWEKGLEVLKTMTPHERTNHFNMAAWGVKTDCGTVACAAGHFSLVPWFRKRGFRSVWRKPVYKEQQAVLDPTMGRSWGLMIREFFYFDENLEDHYAWDNASELDQIAYRGAQVLFDGRRNHAEVVRHVEGTIARLKEYRDRVKKPPRTTTSVPV